MGAGCRTALCGHRHNLPGFPALYQDEVLTPSEIYPAGSTLRETAARIRQNYSDFDSGHILRPRRTANPERLHAAVTETVVPTGFFKVIVKPASDGDPLRAIGFLIPHSFESLDQLSDHYPGLSRDEAFWAFAARIDLIEDATGLTFSIPGEQVKSRWRDAWFFERKGSRDIRHNTCGTGQPMGVLLNTSQSDRQAACLPGNFN